MKCLFYCSCDCFESVTFASVYGAAKFKYTKVVVTDYSLVRNLYYLRVAMKVAFFKIVSFW